MSRLGHYALVLWLAVSLNFLLPRLMPGTPLALLAGTDIAALTPEQRDQLLAAAALDRPLAVRSWRYLGDLVHGNLGYSYQRRSPVASLLTERLPWTLLLTFTAELLALALGVTLGTLAAWRRWADGPLLAAVVVLDALPAFWVAMLLVAFLAVALPVFPAFGALTPGARLEGVAWLADAIRHLALPLATLVIAGIAGPFLITRTSTGLVLAAPFIAAARARGTGEWRILWRHGLRNALLPVAAAGAINLGAAVGGATVVETVFSYPGVGRLLFEAVLGRDYPVIQGVFLLFTVAVVAANALADVLQVRLDPRLRHAGFDTAPAR